MMIINKLLKYPMKYQLIFAFICAAICGIFFISVSLFYDHKAIYHDDQSFRCNYKTLKGSFIEDIILPYDIKHNKTTLKELEVYYESINNETAFLMKYLNNMIIIIGDLDKNIQDQSLLPNDTIQTKAFKKTDNFNFVEFNNYYTKFESILKLRICFAYYMEPHISRKYNNTLYIENYNEYTRMINILHAINKKLKLISESIYKQLSYYGNYRDVYKKIEHIDMNFNNIVDLSNNLKGEISLLDKHGPNSEPVYSINDYKNIIMTDDQIPYVINSYNGSHISTFYTKKLLENLFVKIEIFDKNMNTKNHCLSLRNVINALKIKKSYDLKSKIKLINESMMKYHETKDSSISKRTELEDIVRLTLEILDIESLSYANGEISISALKIDENHEISNILVKITQRISETKTKYPMDYEYAYDAIVNDFVHNFGRILLIRIGYDPDVDKVILNIGMEEN